MNKLYQGEVLKRVMNDKELREFHEKYSSGLKHRKDSFISKQDERIAREWKDGATVSELTQKYKMSHSKVESRIRAVAKSHFLNS